MFLASSLRKVLSTLTPFGFFIRPNMSFATVWRTCTADPISREHSAGQTQAAPPFREGHPAVVRCRRRLTLTALWLGSPPCAAFRSMRPPKSK